MKRDGVGAAEIGLNAGAADIGLNAVSPSCFLPLTVANRIASCRPPRIL